MRSSTSSSSCIFWSTPPPSSGITAEEMGVCGPTTDESLKVEEEVRMVWRCGRVGDGDGKRGGALDFGGVFSTMLMVGTGDSGGVGSREVVEWSLFFRASSASSSTWLKADRHLVGGRKGTYAEWCLAVEQVRLGLPPHPDIRALHHPPDSSVPCTPYTAEGAFERRSDEVRAVGGEVRGGRASEGEGRCGGVAAE